MIPEIFKVFQIVEVKRNYKVTQFIWEAMGVSYCTIILFKKEIQVNSNYEYNAEK